MKLEGVRVLDLSLFLPGPHLSQVMADHGAEVIKVEPPGEGDPGRHIGLGERGCSVFFRNLNRGKRSVTLNLKAPAAREALMRIAESADVFIEAFRPGVAARLGFDYEAVRERNPRIIYCSISAFGQSGPYRDMPAHDLACEAMAGILSVNLGNDGEPAMPAVPVADFAAASMALAGILMALYRRERTGEGDRLDISMHDAALAWLPNVLGPVFVEKRAPVPKHGAHLGRRRLLPHLPHAGRPARRARRAGTEVRPQPARRMGPAGPGRTLRARPRRTPAAGRRIPAGHVRHKDAGRVGRVVSRAGRLLRAREEPARGIRRRSRPLARHAPRR